MRIVRLSLRALLFLTPLGCPRETPPTTRRAATAEAIDVSLGAPANDSIARTAAQFTQGFYDWYGGVGEQTDVAVRERPSTFAPQLLEALRLDFAAQSKSPDEIVGLDWDPFLATQDPCNPYRVSQITRRSDTILVAVKGLCTDAAPHAGPDVIAEVGQTRGRWAFLDFRHAGDRGSLLQDLAALRQGRDSEPSRRRQ